MYPTRPVQSDAPFAEDTLHGRAVFDHLYVRGDTTPRDRSDPHLYKRGWAFVAPGQIREARLRDYLLQLEREITGPEGGGLAALLNLVLVKTDVTRVYKMLDGMSWKAACDDYGDGSAHEFFRGVRTFGGYRSGYGPGEKIHVRGGGRYRWVGCPYHGERTPSMAYGLDWRAWHCFGCGQQGTHWSMTADMLRISPREAVDFLRRAYGMHRPPWRLSSPARNQALKVYGHLLPGRAGNPTATRRTR